MENLLKRGMKSTKCMSDLCESCPRREFVKDYHFKDSRF